MRFSINTEKLQAMVTEVSHGVGNNKLLPITSMLGIKFNEGKLYLSSFDGANLLRIGSHLGVTDEENYGDVTVNADMFVKLVSKLSDCSDIDIETDGSSPILIVSAYKGTKDVGTYKLELPLDENGDIIRYVDMDAKKGDTTKVDDVYNVSVALINEMIASCKPALATDVSETCYKNYLVSEKIVATDRTRAVFLDNDGYEEDDKHYLLGRQFVDLLSLAEEEVSLYIFEDHMYATDGHGLEIVTSSNGDVADFNEKAIQGMLAMKFESMCKVNKSELLNTLNRMALFCNKYENNVIDISFKEDSLVINSLKNSAVEEIDYTEFKDVTPFDIRIDVTLLLTHVKSYASENVELHFGNKTCIKLVDGSVVQIVALMSKGSDAK